MMRSTVLSLVAATLALVPGTPAGQRTAVEPDSNRAVRLAVTPAQIDPAGKLSLLAQPDEQTNDNAAELYAKAAQALPRTTNDEQVRSWLDAPLSELPQTRVQVVLQQAKTSLELASQAAQCKKTDWPPFQPGKMPANLTEYRDLARLLCLQTRLQIAQKRYDAAIETTRIGLTMARQLAEGPTVVQGTVGTAIAAMVLQGVEDLAQASGSPNLFNALQALPHPVVDLDQPISSELENLDSNQQYSALTRRVLRRQMESSLERIRQLMHRVDGTVAALQTIEALRHYAATHDGSLPARLADIERVKIPLDPASGEPLAYHIENSTAILEVSAPKGGKSKDAVCYEITVVR
jgi:hypothetical protein